MIFYYKGTACDDTLFRPSWLTVRLFSVFLLLVTLGGKTYAGKTNQVPGQSASDIVVTGTVRDSAGLAVPAVSVTVKGSRQGTLTDVAGKFRITVTDANAMLTFTSIGYTTTEIRLNGRQQVDVTLRTEAKSLNDVVVIGYGSVRKRDLTGSVASVKGEDLKNVPAQNVMESIQGKIPGADITRSSGQTGSGVNVTLRGNRSIQGNNSPLFVVDGAIYYGNVGDIDPNDVQSIDVLKDASSTAIYGSRGANGVIIITTKRGVTGKTQVTANSYAGISSVSRYYDVASGPEFVAWKRESRRTTGVWNSPADDSKIFSAGELAAIAAGAYTNYQDLLLHNGLQQNHQIGISSGSEKTKVYFSGTYYNEKGLFKLDELKRYSGRITIDQTVNNWLKAGIQAQIVYYNQKFRGDPLNAANKINPLGAAYDVNGNFILQPLPGGAYNPLAEEQPGAYAGLGRNSRTFATIYAEVTPLTGLSIRSNFTANLSYGRTGYFYGPNTLARNGAAAQSLYSSTNSADILSETVANYTRRIKEHNFTLTGIFSYQNRTTDGGSGQGVGQLLASQIFYGLGAATSQISTSTTYSRQDIVSGAGRLNYSYHDKYLFTLTGRADGSSKLASGHQWTFFPSAAAAWRVSEESFLKGNGTLNDLKFRASYGVAGNDPYNPYVTQSVLTPQPYSFGENGAFGYAYNPQIGNLDLRWERSTTLDIGFDFALLNNRLTGTVDVYDTKTNDLLLPRRLPATSGVTSTVQNIGKTNNKGIEMSLTSTNIKSNDWQWTTTVNFTSNKEKIVQLVSAGVNDIASGYFVGYPSQVYYDYERLGIWQTSEAADAARFGQTPGTIKVKDQNGDGKITAQDDRVILGTPRPKWLGSLDNSVKYKNLDLNVYVFARVGQLVAPDFLGVKSNYGENTAAAGLPYWTPEKQSGNFPRPNANGGFLYTSTMNITSGTFVRIRDITLGYTFSKKLFGGVFKSLRIYANAKNYFTFTNDRIKDYDPERGGAENFPMTKLLTAGINVNF